MRGQRTPGWLRGVFAEGGAQEEERATRAEGLPGLCSAPAFTDADVVDALWHGCMMYDMHGCRHVCSERF
eukprot:359907-Chlamydomonas_euryale.AAC.2